MSLRFYPFALVAAMAILFVISGCGSTRNMTVEKGQIAPDFPSYTGTLLVLKYYGNETETMNRKLKKNFDAFYSGKYALIEKYQLHTMYTDTEQYRYMVELFTNVEGFGKFKMTDRKTGQEYSTNWQQAYYYIPQHYARALETCRIK